ncbi:MAG TPA: glycosyltransferase, partial [Kiritimatiellia bacterium]|nr:glycosyltransferase [Kiritimatiellia bacterium]
MLETSVIIINWNRKADAANAIQSVLENQPDSTEILLWDNGSTDGSRELLTDRFSDNSRVRLHWHHENAGVCRSRNLAVQLTLGEILVFMDSDSLLETPDGLTSAAQRLKSDPKTGALNFEILNGHKRVCWPYSRQIEFWGKREFEITRIDGCGFAIRRDVFISAGGFPEHFGYGAEEHFLARRCIAEGYRVVYYPQVTVTHLHVPSGRTSDQFATMMRNHIWMPLELFRLPWALFSALGMLVVYGRDAWREKRMRDFWKGLAWAIRDFKLNRRQPMSRKAWRHFRD